MRAQRLYREPGGDVVGVVRQLLAVQAQDIAASPVALHARSPAITATDVRAARDERSVIRLWGPRGTIHLIAADDVPRLFPVIRSASTTSLRRLAQMGVHLSEDDAVRAVDRALAGCGPVSKAELGERLTAGGVHATGQAIAALAALAASLVVFGPDRGGKPTYVYAADWLGHPIPVEADGDTALAELARRYLRAHEPAGPRDLASWSGLPLRDARAAWHAIADELTQISADLWTLDRGVTASKAAETETTPGVDPVVRLLPIWDEYLLGWEATLAWAAPESYRPVIHSGRPVLLVDGRVAGTWRPARTATRLQVTVQPFDTLDDRVSELLADEAHDLGRSLGLRPSVTVTAPDDAAG